MSVIPVKLTFEDTIRRFSVSDKCTFAELQSLLAKVLNVPITTGAYVIQYTDDENERVTVMSDEELQEAFRISQNTPNKIFRVHVVPRTAPRACPAFSPHMRPRCPKFGRHPFPGCKIFRRFWQSFDSAQESEEEHNEIHPFVICDGCGQTPIFGPRFKCATCPDYDLCISCYNKKVHSVAAPHHEFLRAVGHGKFEPVKSSSNNEAASDAATPEHDPSETIVTEAHTQPAQAAPEPNNKSNEKEQKDEKIEKSPTATQSSEAQQEHTDGPSRFNEALHALESMGFVDRQKNIEALVVTRGDISRAVQYLLDH